METVTLSKTVVPWVESRACAQVLERTAALFFQVGCLEEELQHLVLVAADIKKIIAFKEYLSPNEGGVIALLEHLQQMGRGLIVSVGTERSFFDLLLSDPTKCEGLVVIDINPRVKAYVDFNTMLLRIANDRREYVELSLLFHQSDEDLEEEGGGYYYGGLASQKNRATRYSKAHQESAIAEKARLLRDKLKSSDIPPLQREYYINNLDAYASVYYGEQIRDLPDWRNCAAYDGVKYHEEDAQFNKLQAYAKAGQIIAIEGNIENLQMLDHRRIALIDIANIPDYTSLHFQGRDLHPQVIWTVQNSLQTSYHSYRYSS